MATGATSKEYQIGPRTPGWRTRMVRHYHEQHPKLRPVALHRVIRQLHPEQAPSLAVVARVMSRAGVDAAKARAKLKTRRKSALKRGHNLSPQAQADRQAKLDAAKPPQVKRSRLSHDKVREKAAAEHHRSLMKLKRLAHEVGGLPRVHKLLAELTELSS